MYVLVRGLDNIENGLSLCSKELYRRRKAGSMLLRMNNLAMPPAFPVEQFNLIHEACDRFREHANYLQFQGAWNAVAYRYKAMIEYDERFTASVAQVGAGPADRYPQERDLFGFASSTYSMFDALHYAMYAIGSFSDASNFPLRRLTMSGKLVSKAPKEHLAARLRAIQLQNIFREFRRMISAPISIHCVTCLHIAPVHHALSD